MISKNSPTCVACGYDLQGLDAECTCPECGAPSAGIIVERPLTIRRWLAQACRFAAAPANALRRPIVHGRADAWTSLANLVVGTGLACIASSLPLVAESIHQARRHDLGLGTVNDAARGIALAIITACGGGLIVGILLAMLHRGIVATASPERLRSSRARTRAVLAASSYPVLLVGVATMLLMTTPLFVASLLRSPTVGPSLSPAWGSAASAASLLAATASLLLATLICCRAAGTRGDQPSATRAKPAAAESPTRSD